MKRQIRQSILKKSVCLVAIFVAFPLLQANIYSSENHKIASTNHETDFVSIFGEFNRSLRSNPFTYLSQFEFKVKETPTNPSTNINSRGFLNEIHLASFLNSHNSKIKFSEAKNFASKYIQHCKSEGINHDIAFAQMCLETAYLKFGGSVSSKQNNFCGLGAVNKQSEGESFKTIEIGIIAHVQHLKAYASKDKLNSALVDNRFKYVKRGSAKTVNDLTGKWATDTKYGEKIEKLLHRMYSI